MRKKDNIGLQVRKISRDGWRKFGLEVYHNMVRERAESYQLAMQRRPQIISREILCQKCSLQLDLQI